MLHPQYTFTFITTHSRGSENIRVSLSLLLENQIWFAYRFAFRRECVHVFARIYEKESLCEFTCVCDIACACSCLRIRVCV